MHRLITYLCPLLLLAISLGGCVSWTSGNKVTQAREGVEPQDGQLRANMLVTPQWLMANMDKNNLVIVHVAATDEGYNRGHLPMAQLVLLDKIAVTRDGLPNEVPPVSQLVELLRTLGVGVGDRVIAYDEANGVQAARFYVAMDYIGLGNRTSLLDGQIKSWQLAGGKLTTETAKTNDYNYVPRLHPEIFVPINVVADAVWLQQNLSDARISMVDVRSEKEFLGETAGEGIERPGHIPGAINMPYSGMIRSKENPLLLTPQELRGQLGDKGVLMEDTVIVYCRTGGQGAYGYFVLKYLGYKVRLYDGSYYQWSRTKDMPVVNEKAERAAAQ